MSRLNQPFQLPLEALARITVGGTSVDPRAAPYALVFRALLTAGTFGWLWPED